MFYDTQLVAALNTHEGYHERTEKTNEEPFKKQENCDLIRKVRRRSSKFFLREKHTLIQMNFSPLFSHNEDAIIIKWQRFGSVPPPIIRSNNLKYN